MIAKYCLYWGELLQLSGAGCGFPKEVGEEAPNTQKEATFPERLPLIRLLVSPGWVIIKLGHLVIWCQSLPRRFSVDATDTSAGLMRFVVEIVERFSEF